nr:16S rRNA (guanine(527)-N(7))-methyltransferase RsmG [Nanchangia anserum]
MGAAFAPIAYFGQMLVDEGELRGLIGPREVSRLWSRHLLNCAAVAKFIPDSRDVTIADVGSGAGLPGIVLACQRPDAQVVLIEAMERRVQWLSEVVGELDLDNVDIVNARSTDLPKRVKFDYVTSRAVAAMSKLVRISGHLVSGGGQLLAIKGRRAGEEIEAARYDLKKAGLIDVGVHEVINPMDEEPSRIVVATKRR